MHPDISISYNYKLTLDMICLPHFHLWYILTLFYYRLILLFFSKNLNNHRRPVLVLSIIISIIGGFIPIDWQLSIQRTFTFLPFFVLGYYSVDFDLIRFIKRLIPCKWSITILVAIFITLYFMVDFSLGKYLFGALSYWNNYHGDLKNFMNLLGGRICFLFISIITGIIIMRLVPSNRYLAKWGIDTMIIFIYHAVVLHCGLFYLIDSCHIPQNEFMLFFYAVIVVFVLLLFSRIKILHQMLNPFSCLFS